jgi:pimeloyl-ACP methyl ester carboxylesterase
MDFIQGASGRLRVERLGGGAGIPAVFVHGNGCARSHWHLVAPGLADGRTVITYDQRGFGESDFPKDGDFSLAAMSADLVRVVESSGLGACVLIGHSYGGAVVADAVGRYPKGFAGAVFLDASGDSRNIPPAEVAEFRANMAPERFGAYTRQWFEAVLAGARPATRTLVLDTLARTTPASFARAMEATLSFDPAAALRHFSGPKLLATVRAYDGPFALRAAVPELPNVWVDDSSHWLQLDQPELVRMLLAEFLATLDS